MSRAQTAAPAPAAAPNSREQQKIATRRAVLSSALEVFSERGFDGATTRDIAARAGVNHAMIQYYFQNKEQLWRAAVRFLFDRLAEEVSLSPDRIEGEFGGDVRAWAEACLTEYTCYCAKHPDHARLMMQESVRAGDRLDWVSRHYTRYNKEAGERFYGRLMAEGLVPRLELAPLIYTMVGASQLFYALAPEVRAVWGLDPQSDAMVRAHIEVVKTLLLGSRESVRK